VKQKAENILRVAVVALLAVGAGVGPALSAARIRVVPRGAVQPGPAARAAPAEEVEPDAEEARPLPLVNVDEELCDCLEDAQDLIAAEDYARAIEILQALLDRAGQCFVTTSDPRRYVSLSLRVSELLGQMPAEGLQLYRRLNDAQAERLFRPAADRCDEAGLREVARRFLHSSVGAQAVNLLGTILFDRGEFSQAARCWRDLLDIRDGGVDEPTLLAKIAVAHHFAGEGHRAEEALKLLSERHARAEAVLAGREQPVVGFVRRLLASPGPQSVGPRAQLRDWPSLMGRPDGLGVMSPCRPVLSPRWTRPEGKLRFNPNVRAITGAIPLIHQPWNSARGQPPGQVDLDEGRLVIALRSGSRTRQTTLPATIHPIVVGETVLCREADEVAAYDLLTGQKLWASFNFPLYRSLGAGVRVRGSYSSVAVAEDSGAWSLSAADGKVLAVGNFLPPAYRFRRAAAAVRGQRQLADTSELAALSLPGQGRLLWRVGAGKGSAEIVRNCRFLTAPTCAAGKAYVLAEYLESHHLLCLSAETGELVWSALVGQMPVASGSYTSAYLDLSSPPAIAGGRVLVVTNAGVVAAFDAATGRALWAYQYPSAFSQGRSGPIQFRYGQVNTAYPPNPIIVTQGLAITLPADSGQLLGLRADTGRLAWGVSRRGQRDLSAVDESRVLLSGENLFIVDAATGRERWSAPAYVREVFGRPAVTTDDILASGKGELIRVRLADLSVSRPPLVRPDGILGNLVCVRGKLLAANGAGISAYFAYEDMRAELTRRIRTASRRQAAELLYERGMNAFHARKPQQALPDLLSARRLAKETGNGALMARTQQALYRTYVCLGNRASADADRAGLFFKAQEFCYSPCSRAEMLVRLSKHFEQIGLPMRAVEHAHKLISEYPDTDVVDVDVGVAADPFVREDSDSPRQTGYEVGSRRIRELIAAHGQRCYAAFDAKARSKLNAAIAAGDAEAMVEVATAYPSSAWAPEALLRAGEWYFHRALRSPEEDSRQLLGLAGECLGRIVRDYSDSKALASAWLGLAAIREKRSPNMVWLALRGLEKLPPDAAASFAGLSGSVAEILERFASRRRPTGAAGSEPLEAITPPLRRLLADQSPGVLLRGTDGRAVRVGSSLFLLRGDRLALLDVTAGTFADAIRWETPLPVDTKTAYRYGFTRWAYHMAAGLTADGAVLAVLTRGGCAGLEVATGRIRWRLDLADLGVQAGQWHSLAMADDEFIILGKSGAVLVFDKRSGKLLWRHAVKQSWLPWRSAAQVSGDLLLTLHGRASLMATLFDMSTRKCLGTVKIGPAATAQAELTPGGLLIFSDGQWLRLVEPIADLSQPVWSVRLERKSARPIVAVTDEHVLVAPDELGVVQLRSLIDQGRTVQSFRIASPAAGGAPVVLEARMAGDCLWVLAGSAGSSRSASTIFSSCRDPSLQAFELSTGNALWPAVNLASSGGVHYVMPLEVGRDHVCAIARPQPGTRPGRLRIIGRATGQDVQEPVYVPGAAPGHRVGPFRYMMGTSPVMIAGRLVVDSPNGVIVHGKSK